MTHMRSVAALFLLIAMPVIEAQAQDPVRLPSVIIKEKPAPPGPKLLVGVVKDTSDWAVEGVEISIPDLKRIAFSNAEGRFRFENVPRGKYSMRARKIGYAAQVRSFTVEADGGIAEFEIMPLARALPTVVTTAVRRGLSGTVGDTSFRAIEGAEVAVLGKDIFATTDSVGGFFLPVPPGRYMVTIKRAGYADKVAAVSIPEDSGRKLTAFLTPRRPVEIRARNNLSDLQQRMAWSNKLLQPIYTREDIQKLDIVFILDLANMAARTQIDPDCYVLVNGGPGIAELSTLTVDDVESVEAYGGAGMFRPVTMAADPRLFGKKATPMISSKLAKPPKLGTVVAPSSPELAAANFGKRCIGANVWLR